MGKSDVWDPSEVDLFPLVPCESRKEDLPCVSFASFNGTRRAENVSAVNALAFDIDHWRGTLEQFATAIGALEVQAAWHTTFSAGPDALRFRVVLAVSRPMTAPEYPRVWRVVATALGLEGLDPVCKDANRLWFEPAVPASGFYASGQAEGEAVDVDRALFACDEIDRASFPPSAPRGSVSCSGDRIERARCYLARVEPSVSGHGGHVSAFRAASILVRKFGFSDAEALPLLREWNERCLPPWSPKDLSRKLNEARKASRMPEGIAERNRE